MSLWTMASTAATVFRIFADGCRETILPLFGPLLGFLVSDRATVFSFWAMELRQMCQAHLLRKFVSFSERDGPAGDIGRELLRLHLAAVRVLARLQGRRADPTGAAVLDAPGSARHRARARARRGGRHRSTVGLVRRHPRAPRALWTFVEHDGVEPTNNHAELELRDFVLWRKRSFGSQSERGKRFAERVMTAVHTARKQGKDVLDFLVRTVTAHVQGAPLPRLLGGEAAA